MNPEVKGDLAVVPLPVWLTLVLCLSRVKLLPQTVHSWEFFLGCFAILCIGSEAPGFLL